MTQEEIINTITTCSGMTGITEFERLPKDYFLKWFLYNIQYNSESSKKQGLELIEYLKNTKDMTYGDFNKKYNKRDYRGVILSTSIIDMNGNILFQGTIDEVGEYWDEHVELIWQDNKVIDEKIDGVSAITTNIGHTDTYAKYCFNKLNFNVI
jgi:hypothetical protein